MARRATTESRLNGDAALSIVAPMTQKTEKIGFSLPVVASIFILALVPFSAMAQTVPGDADYKVHQSPGYRIIYSQEYESLIPELDAYNRLLRERYQKEFSWHFDETADLILVSSQNQIANGFATQYPRLMTYFFDGGPQLIDDFGATSWLYTLLSHETVHMYQLNVRHGYSSFLKNVFKNATPNFLPPFTYMITPHLFTPTFIMEGNAVFNESRFGNGGRLHSGLYRALFLQMLKSGKVTADRLINDHIQWPFTTEKYIVGAYLQSYLAETYGTQRTNSYFTIHANYAYFPLLLKRGFQDTFGIGYMQAIDGLKNHYSELAGRQTVGASQALATSYQHQAFTEAGDDILFMTDDYKTDPNVCRVVKATGTVTCEASRLPFGRVFRYGGRYVTSASEQMSPSAIRFSLFAPGYKEVEGHRNHVVYALNDQHAVYADALSSMKETRLFKDGQFVDTTQSSPYMDAEGALYYFKQEGPKRTLYRDGKALFSIDGHYGKVTNATEDLIEFTGAEETGSGLFRWHDGHIEKIVASDAVVDAKRLGTGSYLICEITAHGYDFKIAPESVSEASPAPLHYSYDNDEDLRFLANVTTPPATDVSTAEPSPTLTSSSAINTKDDTDYRPFWNMEYNGTDPFVLYASDVEWIWALNARFSDPLQKYLLSFLVQDTGFDSHGAALQFINAENPLQWIFQSSYQLEAVTRANSLDPDKTELVGHYADTEVDLGVSYPLLQHPLWKAESSLLYLYKNREIKDPAVSAYATDRDKNAGLLQFGFGYGVAHPLNFDSYRTYNLNLAYKHEGLRGSWEQPIDVYMGQASLNYDLGWETFFSAGYDYGTTKGSRRGMELDDDELAATLDPTEIYSKSGDRFHGLYADLAKTNAQLKKAIHIGLFNRIIPLGLTRIAPYVGYNEYYGAKIVDDSMETLFHETYYGADIELLLLHKFRFRLSAVKVKNSYEANLYRIGATHHWNF